MSRENVEPAKRGIELWNRGDMDALRERYHPNAVMHHPSGWPEPVRPSDGTQSSPSSADCARTMRPTSWR